MLSNSHKVGRFGWMDGSAKRSTLTRKTLILTQTYIFFFFNQVVNLHMTKQSDEKMIYFVMVFCNATYSMNRSV